MRTTTRDDITIRTAGGEDVPAIAELLGAAFQDDPRMAALLPDPAHRADKLGPLFSLLLSQEHPGHAAELAWRDGRLEAAAVWDRPGGPVTPLARRLYHLPALLSIFRWRIPDAVRAIETLNASDSHRPDEPHWHLFAIGTHPQRRGRGVAGALLASGLDRADDHDTPVYVETTAHAGVTHFREHGFRVIHEFPVAGGLTVYGMWRTPRG
ncbi:GNAT family N-acetyltransferase [Saccharopolyspora rosea]|uniref:GNAT family N-acetyltransferase n=1 Tax=Saccharopolyspora rosea TaxID=524884 RepID=A0ABW3FUR7_9PSEU|nr:GNAT family N-acetyltransferase [Saccharopolyspora rosea]